MLLPRTTRKAGINEESNYLKAKRTKEAKTPEKDEPESGELTCHLSYPSQGHFPILYADRRPIMRLYWGTEKTIELLTDTSGEGGSSTQLIFISEH